MSFLHGIPSSNIIFKSDRGVPLCVRLLYSMLYRLILSAHNASMHGAIIPTLFATTMVISTRPMSSTVTLASTPAAPHLTFRWSNPTLAAPAPNLPLPLEPPMALSSAIRRSRGALVTSHHAQPILKARTARMAAARHCRSRNMRGYAVDLALVSLEKVAEVLRKLGELGAKFVLQVEHDALLIGDQVEQAHQSKVPDVVAAEPGHSLAWCRPEALQFLGSLRRPLLGLLLGLVDLRLGLRLGLLASLGLRSRKRAVECNDLAWRRNAEAYKSLRRARGAGS